MCERAKWLPVFALAVFIASVISYEACPAAQMGAVKAVEGEARVNNSGKSEFRALKTGDPIRLKIRYRLTRTPKLR